MGGRTGRHAELTGSLRNESDTCGNFGARSLLNLQSATPYRATLQAQRFFLFNRLPGRRGDRVSATGDTVLRLAHHGY